MKKPLSLASAFSVGLLLFSCASSKHPDYGKEEHQVCGDEAEQIGENYFFGIGEAKNIISQESKEDAFIAAKRFLAGKMNSYVKTETTEIVNKSEDPRSTQIDVDKKREDYVDQALRGLSVFCSKTYKNKEGLYTSFSGVKLDIKKQDFLRKFREEYEL